MRAIALAVALLALAACSAVGGGPPAPTPLPTPSAGERGAALFVNKGCITCHHHAAVGYEGTIIGVGPVLTAYSNDEAFLRDWLRNPAAMKPGATMPTLGLAEGEIEALIAFLNGGR
ncbi:MAG TPA: c-type cytochrome [Chloroflexaceae bacterium]|nr:c-type cytochrome [Chloroflexaceae bacterium]